MTKQPVLFIGHGSPMNAIEDNAFTRSLAEMGKAIIPKPAAVMVVSAHWLTSGTYVSVNPKPETIYDFGGFPDELYRIKYPAQGSPEFANEVIKLIPEIHEDSNWGLDHGSWAVLKHIIPKADIPVFQLSIDYKKPMQYHFDLAQKLKPLRDKGVLIIGSGNIVHNLRLWFSQTGSESLDWAVEFDEWLKNKIMERDFQSLINYEKQGKAAELSVPTVDHYVPLLYCLGLTEESDVIEFVYEGVESSLSMRSIKIG
ncbi:MAG: 4,5-DOPA dioxygenase extradiol [Ignavibacteriae bacterium]|nr:4,5-DOPA dioxygenase extradiol [Ignavibacteriota bacterium]